MACLQSFWKPIRCPVLRTWSSRPMPFVTTTCLPRCISEKKEHQALLSAAGLLHETLSVWQVGMLHCSVFTANTTNQSGSSSWKPKPIVPTVLRQDVLLKYMARFKIVCIRTMNLWIECTDVNFLLYTYWIHKSQGIFLCRNCPMRLYSSVFTAYVQHWSAPIQPWLCFIHL